VRFIDGEAEVFVEAAGDRIGVPAYVAAVGPVALRTAAMNLHAGITLCVRTGQNRLSAVSVANLPDPNAASPALTIQYTTCE
jgi:hypothetical protein